MNIIAKTNQEDKSRLDYLETVRRINYATVKRLIEDYDSRVVSHVAAGGGEPTTKEQAGDLYTSDPTYLFACAIQHNAQRSSWTTAQSVVEGMKAELSAEITAAIESSAHGTLELSSGTVLPDWYVTQAREGLDDIHLVPGGYWGEQLVGPIYELGAGVYNLRWRGGYGLRPSGAYEAFVNSMPGGLGACKRVLDLGCSFGAVTRALRKAVPSDAEVIGIDISAPALIYAHYLSEMAGARIAFSQRDAAATDFDNDSFDLVTASLLLHEVPQDAHGKIFEEAFRVLRPGGYLLFIEIPPYRELNVVEAFFQSFDARGNGEIFWDGFLDRDLNQLLEFAGFESIEQGPLDYHDPEHWGAAALFRTQEYKAKNRWVVKARKP